MVPDRVWSDAWPLACPVCDSALSPSGERLVCPAGHSFDVAREGYVNLLTDADRRRGIDGDAVAMVQARRAFHDEGHFEPLRDLLSGEVERLLSERDSSSPGPRACIAEVGCGEGYYIGGVAGRLAQAAPNTTCVGVDLSKTAVRYAAKRYPAVRFFVADTHSRLYLQTSSVAVLLDVFAPRDPDEFARVLEPGGHLLVAIPSDAHLEPIRTELGLLGIQEDKERRVLERFGDGFALVGRTEVEFPMTLTRAALESLIDMGPSHWHSNAGQREIDAESVQALASFVVLCLQSRT